jgi:hypothetical protein
VLDRGDEDVGLRAGQRQADAALVAGGMPFSSFLHVAPASTLL